jgi:hypothetical protein
MFQCIESSSGSQPCALLKLPNLLKSQLLLLFTYLFLNSIGLTPGGSSFSPFLQATKALKESRGIALLCV